MANFLLEIGLEEVPAHLVTPAINQLVARTENFFADERLSHGEIVPFSTPRRLAVLVKDVAEKAEDVEEELKGPAKKIALDADGNFTKAAIGFARGKGMTTADIIFKEFNGAEYVTLNKFEAGQPAAEVLTKFKTVIEAMTFSTTMKWGRHSFEYVRPIRWLVALLDTAIIPFDILGVATGRVSRGHRFLGHDVEIASATAYEEALKAVFVEANAAERKANIRHQVEAIAANNNWQVVIDEDLLEEVNNIVEFPTAFAGGFAEDYLEVPDEVLITSMKEHQRFFHVIDAAGHLLPHFISVRNGNAEHIDNVIAGNEKVLIARLEDAKFFYHEDQKHDIDFYNNKLNVVSFHEKLGSVANHTHRAKVIALVIAKALGLEAAEVAKLGRAADIYKFDLMTGMVGEFDELQGVMGEKYAVLFGEDAAVAQAVREHYMPLGAGTATPESTLGNILALADKLDSLLSFFAGDMIPSGSNDPYGLRRAATGVVAILADTNWSLDVRELLIAAIAEINATEDFIGLPEAVAAQLLTNVDHVIDFLTDRVVKALKDDGVRVDIINAVTKNNNADTTAVMITAKVLQAHVDDANFREGVEALTRVARLTSKNPTAAVVDTALFENEAEKTLFAEISAFNASSADERLVKLLALQPAIAAYFDVTMVMVEDEAVKNNRLATLALVSKESEQLANFMELDVKSN
ncbi:glycine--tRNA ligase subunit beta [Weissella soli]|uniref:Glycine--tRNA ligase beta subunit n=1 Tax=Weissella soli TaxID=155866 RepID=A0A288Q672_9LACO|nr:glycine--tRNA ligase subunit beta [Weissella soli]AOT56055.1 Glycine--tRNA ligase [Weissella soli]NKY82516.1 glycine--tRNA ligase subunit beta [Weissella soli]RDL11629.1 glycyl-tRNA synthetase beta chain [Weissella soli]GEN93144.1 glycine--tRNA ligase beta subunit [Weissella soli]